MGDKRQDIQVYTPVPPANPGDPATWARYGPTPTVVGGNEPLPPKHWLTAFGIFALILLAMLGIIVGIFWNYDMDIRAGFLIWGIFAMVALVKGFALWMDYGSGDKAARDEIKAKERAHSRALQHDDKAHERSTVAWTRQQEMQHEYRMAALAEETKRMEQQRELRAMEFRLAHGGDPYFPAMRTDNYVHYAPDPAVPAVKEWVMSIYTDEGVPDPKLFHANGWMKGARPWNTIWKSEPWADDARRIVEEHVLRPEGTGHALRDGFGNSHDASVNLVEINP